jgi:predicted lipoprotein with Yx(FWY)xxD motif
MRHGITRYSALFLSCLLLAAVVPAALAAPARQSTPTLQISNNLKYGKILVNSQGMTLYLLTSEAGGAIKCSGGCLGFWPPLTVPAGSSAPATPAGVTGKLGTITRSDGTVQVTYNGYPLYMFANDKAAGDTNGQGIQAFGGTWNVVQASVPLAATAIERLVVRITATDGTVWGRVTARYSYAGRHTQLSCAQATCSFLVPYGVTVHLRQTAIDAATWPFKQWQIRAKAGATRRMQGSASLRMVTNYRVRAIYVLG